MYPHNDSYVCTRAHLNTFNMCFALTHISWPLLMHVYIYIHKYLCWCTCSKICVDVDVQAMYFVHMYLFAHVQYCVYVHVFRLLYKRIFCLQLKVNICMCRPSIYEDMGMCLSVWVSLNICVCTHSSMYTYM